MADGEAEDGGIDPVEGNGMGGGNGPGLSDDSSANNEPDKGGGDEMAKKKVRRRGWIGQVPGAFNGGMNDTGAAMLIVAQTQGQVDMHQGTGFDGNGEPVINDPNGWKMPQMASEEMPAWMYSRADDRRPRPKGGDPNAGKGSM